MPSNTQMLWAFNWWNGLLKVDVPKSSKPVRFAVLGAADFSPIGLFGPAKSHPDVVVVAIGARSLQKAEAQAKKYNVPRAYGSYDEVIRQDDIDAIYIPLPIGYHAEWAIKAMKAGKHVLIEKAITVNADEAIKIQECARETGKVAMEAFHYQFHPCNHVVKAIIDSQRYGELVSTSASLCIPKLFNDDDIRFQYKTGGGACLDLAYIFSSTLFFTGGDGEYEVLKAEPRLNKKDKRVDDAIEVDMIFRTTNSDRTVKCHVSGDLHVPKTWGLIPASGIPYFTAELETAKITVRNFVAPHLFHKITIEDKRTGVTCSQKHYSFGPKWGARSEPWWTTYRYQLEAFVMKIKGEEPPHWIELDNSVAMMKLIDQVYEKAGMLKRGLKE